VLLELFSFVAKQNYATKRKYVGRALSRGRKGQWWGYRVPISRSPSCLHLGQEYPPIKQRKRNQPGVVSSLKNR
jgi:hypothetical protein